MQDGDQRWSVVTNTDYRSCQLSDYIYALWVISITRITRNIALVLQTYVEVRSVVKRDTNSDDKVQCSRRDLGVPKIENTTVLGTS